MAPGKASKWQPFPAFDNISTTSTMSTVPFSSFASGPRSFKNTRPAPFHLPSELTCSLCNKPKNLRAYSQNQQNKYRSTRGEHQIICLSCMGVNKQEMMCSLCDKTLPLKKFAKSQRRGEGQCLDCVAERIGEGRKGFSGWEEMGRLRITEGKGEEGEGGNGDGKEEKGGEVVRGQRYRVGDHRNGPPEVGEDWSDGDESDVSVEDSDSGGSVFSI
ncbi:hypothetical protein CAC42_4851 [Sphaceloma murrayae]|uniref:Stc1 domain-containing protein n=1 Tax=Sphaceloma murrayae TaxID=2082308 RepID=A0A2K1QP47_9PEZI|nr:hypothetical protein CAC42_4851 [Sphaceloma murrayae]